MSGPGGGHGGSGRPSTPTSPNPAPAASLPASAASARHAAPTTSLARQRSVRPAFLTSGLGRDGHVLTEQEMSELRRKHGYCPKCGATRTHKRPGGSKFLHLRGLKPISDDEAYKGHCLRCGGGLARVKQKLGEELTKEEQRMLRNGGVRTRTRRPHLRHTESPPVASASDRPSSGRGRSDTEGTAERSPRRDGAHARSDSNGSGVAGRSSRRHHSIPAQHPPSPTPRTPTTHRSGRHYSMIDEGTPGSHRSTPGSGRHRSSSMLDQGSPPLSNRDVERLEQLGIAPPPLHTPERVPDTRSGRHARFVDSVVEDHHGGLRDDDRAGGPLGMRVSFRDQERQASASSSTRALPESARQFHFVDTGAFHLRHSSSSDVGVLNSDTARALSGLHLATDTVTVGSGSRDADIVEVERRERREERRFLKLGRTDSWDGHDFPQAVSASELHGGSEGEEGSGSGSGSRGSRGTDDDGGGGKIRASAAPSSSRSAKSAKSKRGDDERKRRSSSSKKDRSKRSVVESFSSASAHSRSGDGSASGSMIGSSCVMILDAKVEPFNEAEYDRERMAEATDRVRAEAAKSDGGGGGGGLKAVVSYMSTHGADSSYVVRAACREVRTGAPWAQMDIESQVAAGGSGGGGGDEEGEGGEATKVPPPPPSSSLTRRATLAVANLLPPHWVKVLVVAMRDHPDDPKVQAEVLRTIWTVAALHPRFKSDVCDCGGIDAAVKAMGRRHGHRGADDDGELDGAAVTEDDAAFVEVQLYGCGLLSCLSGSERHARQVREARGVADRLVEAVGYHKKKGSSSDGDDGENGRSTDAENSDDSSARASAVVELALRTLFCLSATTANAEAAGALRVRFRELDLTAAVIGAVEHGKSLSSGVYEWAFDLLSILLTGAIRSPAVGTASIDRVEEEAEGEEKEEGTGSGTDGTSSTAAASLDVSDEIIGAVANAMSDRSDDEGFQLSALGFLCNLSASDAVMTSSLRIVKSIAEASLGAMNQHPKNETVQKYGCWIVSNLCQRSGSDIGAPVSSDGSLLGIEDGRSIVAQSGGVKAILHAMSGHTSKDDAELQGEACLALTCLCTDSVPIKDDVFEADGETIVRDIFRSHMGKTSEQSEHVRCCASRLLATLAVSPNHVSELNASGVMVDIIKSSLDDSCNLSGESAVPPVMLNLLALNSNRGDITARNATTSSVTKFVLQAYKYAEEAEQAVSMLHTLSNTKECVDVLLSTSGAFDRIMEAMYSFPDSVIVQERSCGLLSNIYINADEHHRDYKTLGSERVIQAIVNAMRSHNFREEVQEYACLALRNFCVVFSRTISSETDIISILLEIIVDVIQAMERNKLAAHLQENAAGLLWALAELSEELCLAVTSSGAVRLILDAFVEFPDVADLQREALGALAFFSLLPESTASLGSEEGANAILRRMQTYEDEEEVIERSCMLLSAITAESHAAKMAITEDDETIHRIVGFMFQYPTSFVILKGACTILANVAIDNFIKDQIVNGGGIGRIQIAMTAFSENLSLQEEACKALSCLVQVTPTDMILGDNILNTIIEAMQTHSEILGIQHYGLESLWHIAAKDSRSKRAVAELGGIHAVVGAMQIHISSENVQEKGCVTLWSLAVDDDISALIGQHASAITNGMMAHITHLQLQIEALGALKTLATNLENKERLQNDGSTINTIVSVMWVHGNNSRVQEAAFAALTNIAVNPVTNQVSTISHSELEAVISAMRHFSDLESVQEQGCILLRNYTFSPENVLLLRSNTMVFETLTHAMQHFPANCSDRANYIIDRLFE